MKVSVVGLGVEGVKASNSFLKNGWSVYASDTNNVVDLDELEIPLGKMDLSQENEIISIITDSLRIDLGFNNYSKIENSDVIAFSPSMFGSEFASRLLETGKFFSDTFTKHKDLFTIGITGTNGKTTSVCMLKKILEDAGKKVLVGGNAGGGFEGYYDLMLKANMDDFDVMIVEVCDMTLDFCKYCFDFDIVALTNIGNDHMNVHKTIANYKNSLINFFKNKKIVLHHNQDFKSDFIEISKEHLYSFKYPFDLNVFGEFNRFNAGLASTIAKELKIPKDSIKKSLFEFKPVEGRLDVFNINNAKIYIGKTDNSDAISSILNEEDFYAVFIGTPRSNEKDRLAILDEVVKYSPEFIILFPGLDDTINMAKYHLNIIGYEGNVEVARSLNEIIEYIAEFSHENAIFIGGNGQKTIIEIQDRVKLLSESLS